MGNLGMAFLILSAVILFGLAVWLMRQETPRWDVEEGSAISGLDSGGGHLGGGHVGGGGHF